MRVCEELRVVMLALCRDQYIDEAARPAMLRNFCQSRHPGIAW